VQGYNLTGNDSDTISDISLSGVQSIPEATTEISIGANLDATTITGETFNASQTVYDSLGDIHSLKMTFQKTEGNGVWGVESYLDNFAATSQTQYGVKFDSNGVLEMVYSGAVGAEASSVGGETVEGFVDRPGQVSHTGTFELTGGTEEDTWTITDPGGYTNATILSTSATEITISLDNTSTVADVTLTLSDGCWVEDATVQFTLAGCEAGTGLVTDTNGVTNAALNNPEKFVADGTLKLTRAATADTWDFATVPADQGGYTDAIVLSSSDTEITISLDGGTATDITLTLTGTYIGTNTLEFDLVEGNGTTPTDIELTLAALDTGATIGDSDGNVSWELYGTTAEDITGYASTSVIRTLVHDGYSSGSLKSISVTAGGTISGFFTNGQTSDIAQIVLADFANTGGLKRMGKNLFSTTVESGAAVPNTPGSAGMGDISPNSLEMSNTDIATEFINMITAQRAYQASAKIVTVTDQMMAELMNIKR
jgi:flagellar hook-basal body protein